MPANYATEENEFGIASSYLHPSLACKLTKAPSYYPISNSFGFQVTGVNPLYSVFATLGGRMKTMTCASELRSSNEVGMDLNIAVNKTYTCQFAS